MFVLLFVQGNVAIIRLVRFAIGPEKTVVSIDLFLSFFMPFSYNGVYFRAAQVSYPIPPLYPHFEDPKYVTFILHCTVFD